MYTQLNELMDKGMKPKCCSRSAGESWKEGRFAFQSNSQN
jgi:hypothetical protein